MAVYIIVNRNFYGSTTDMAYAIFTLVVLGVWFIANGVYTFKGFREKTYLAIIPEIVIMGLVFLFMLFVFNASLWDTDTGNFKEVVTHTL